MTSIIALVIALGSIAALAVQLLKRFWKLKPDTGKLQEKVDEITKTIIALEKLPPTYSRVARIKHLYDERLSTNRKIRRIRGK